MLLCFNFICNDDQTSHVLDLLTTSCIPALGLCPNKGHYRLAVQLNIQRTIGGFSQLSMNFTEI